MAKKATTPKKPKKPTAKKKTKTKKLKMTMPAGREMSQPGARGGGPTSGSCFPGYRGQ